MPLLHRFSPVLLFALLASSPAFAQTIRPSDPPNLQSMDALGLNASFHTDFTFSRQLLRELAGGLPGDEDTQRALDHLDSITVHVYRYAQPGLYNPADLDPLRNQYRALGWKHLVAEVRNAADRSGRTDLWIHYDHSNVEGMTLLVMKPTSLNLVEVNGVLSPLDVLHLRGHFGIPRFPADHFTDESGHHAPSEDR